MYPQLKIVVFAPHPDDELFGCGGTILKWLEEGHEVQLVYFSDNRAWLEWAINENELLKEPAKEFLNLTGEQMAQIGINEAKAASKAFGIADSKVHFFKFHDQKISENINEGVSLSKRIVRDAGRIVLPSNGEKHIDHQATHIIVKRAIVDLNQRAEYYIYASYCILTAPKNKQVKIDVSKYREKKYEIMKNYKTQLCIEPMVIAWENFKHKRYERFGVFNYEDIGKFDNF